jgi:hypothetical protein
VDSAFYTRTAKPKTLAKSVGYDAFAVAQTPDDGVTQQSWIIFGYVAASRTWRPLNVGSAEYCEGYAPHEVASHFPGCGG